MRCNKRIFPEVIDHWSITATLPQTFIVPVRGDRCVTDNRYDSFLPYFCISSCVFFFYVLALSRLSPITYHGATRGTQPNKLNTVSSQILFRASKVHTFTGRLPVPLACLLNFLCVWYGHIHNNSSSISSIKRNSSSSSTVGYSNTFPRRKGIHLPAAEYFFARIGAR